MASTTKRLKMPKELWQLPRSKLTWQEKNLLSFFWWTGQQGCFCWNNRLAERFEVNARTVRRWLKGLKEKNLITIADGKGRNRTIWPKAPCDFVDRSL